jgi:hypothetical protein
MDRDDPIIWRSMDHHKEYMSLKEESNCNYTNESCRFFRVDCGGCDKILVESIDKSSTMKDEI